MKIFAHVVLFSAMIGISLAQSKSAERDWQVPPEASARRNPLANRSDTVAGGKKVFLRECAQCHGDQGLGGRRKHAPDLTASEVQEQTDGALFWKITNGNPRHGMPEWSRLPEGVRWQLVLFLRTLPQKSHGP